MIVLNSIGLVAIRFSATAHHNLIKATSIIDKEVTSEVMESELVLVEVRRVKVDEEKEADVNKLLLKTH